MIDAFLSDLSLGGVCVHPLTDGISGSDGVERLRVASTLHGEGAFLLLVCFGIGVSEKRWKSDRGAVWCLSLSYRDGHCLFGSCMSRIYPLYFFGIIIASDVLSSISPTKHRGVPGELRLLS